MSETGLLKQRREIVEALGPIVRFCFSITLVPAVYRSGPFTKLSYVLAGKAKAYLTVHNGMRVDHSPPSG